MKYFANFPKTKETIRGKQIDLVDISYAIYADPEDYQRKKSEMPLASEIASLSLSNYSDADSFWALLYANDAINPWKFIPKTINEYTEENKNYNGFYAKYASSNKLNPNAYVVFQPDDIIVYGDYGSTGATAASSVFTDYSSLDTTGNINAWFVSNAYSDTKKAKITKNVNVGNTSATILGEGEAILVLRKGSTGYYVLPNPFSTVNKNVTSLTNYEYAKSPSFFTEKTKENVVVSPAEKIVEDDTLLSISTNNNVGTSGPIFYQNYDPLPTKKYYEEEYSEKIKYTQIFEANFGKILNKLV